jgi:hypothetical protein
MYVPGERLRRIAHGLGVSTDSLIKTSRGMYFDMILSCIIPLRWSQAVCQCQTKPIAESFISAEPYWRSNVCNQSFITLPKSLGERSFVSTARGVKYS